MTGDDQPEKAEALNFTDAVDWTHDEANPRNWSPARKLSAAAIVAGIGFVSTLAASIYAPGREDVAKDFGVSTTVSLLPLSFYNLGMALGPIIASPMSETLGRKTVYLITTPTFAIFSLSAGFTQSIEALTICRFFAGVFGAPGVSIASATISDIFPPKQRAIPISFYYHVPFVGSLLGPLIGGFLAEKKTWRWTQWTIVFFVVTFLFPIIFVRETYRKTLQKRIAKRRALILNTEPKRSIGEVAQYFIRKTVIRPIHMLFTEPIVSFVCLYTSFQFALLYIFVVASPWTFATIYGFDLGSQGLTFIGFIVGATLSYIAIICGDRFIYQRKLHQFEHEHQAPGTASEFPPEHRLYNGMPGSIILPSGLFLFAWSTHYALHWIIPIVAQAITIFGSIQVYVSASVYMVDTYGPLYGASAAGASSLSRYTLGTIFPLFTLQMFERLGTGWATSLLGFCAVAMAPIPWVFYRWGSTLRARSKYEREL